MARTEREALLRAFQRPIEEILICLEQLRGHEIDRKIPEASGNSVLAIAAHVIANTEENVVEHLGGNRCWPRTGGGIRYQEQHRRPTPRPLERPFAQARNRDWRASGRCPRTGDRPSQPRPYHRTRGAPGRCAPRKRALGGGPDRSRPVDYGARSEVIAIYAR